MIDVLMSGYRIEWFREVLDGVMDDDVNYIIDKFILRVVVYSIVGGV